MATVSVIQGKKLNTTPSPKLIIRTVTSDISYTPPFAPKQVSYYVTGRKYNEVERPDRKPITTSPGISLKQMSMELFIGSNNFEKSIDSDLATLEQLAFTKQILLVEYDPRTQGQWNITSLDYESIERQDGSNIITRANVNIEFTEAIGFNAKTNVASLVAGSASLVASTTSNSNPKTYVIKKGDTLSAISIKFYYTPNKWRVIADANKLDPKNLKVGKTIRIP
jgi:LysM repeat protein